MTAPMLNPILPRQVDNDYRGHKAALWVLALLLLMKVSMSVNSIFNGRLVAISADGIPLDTFTAAGAQTVVSLFAILGLSQLTLCLVGILVLVRYRALMPLLFSLLLLEFVGRRLIFHYLPVPRTGTPPGFTINLILLALMVVGLVLSLWNRGATNREGVT